MKLLLFDFGPERDLFLCSTAGGADFVLFRLAATVDLLLPFDFGPAAAAVGDCFVCLAFASFFTTAEGGEEAGEGEGEGGAVAVLANSTSTFFALLASSPRQARSTFESSVIFLPRVWLGFPGARLDSRSLFLVTSTSNPHTPTRVR